MKQIKKAKFSFQFCSRLIIRELTGIKAHNLDELLSHVKTVPGAVIYHHTHHFLQLHQYLVPEPPNDFAYWVDTSLGYHDLSERLASINTCDYRTIRDLRERIIAVLEKFISEGKASRESNVGEEFYFIKSVSIAFNTPYEVRTLEEFLDVLKRISIDAIYYHMFEAPLRLEKEGNDFSMWIREQLDMGELADKIDCLDPYTHTMEGLRNKLVRVVEDYLFKV
ncbi:MAG: DUF5752 family protein [Candidatus Ancaeobacter aquaticus]|nr:DUF5752 family protein [Candidatus Ancaeobacter aquaticus]